MGRWRRSCLSLYLNITHLPKIYNMCIIDRGSSTRRRWFWKEQRAIIRLNSNIPNNKKEENELHSLKNEFIVKQTACAKEKKSMSVTSSRQERELSVKLKEPVNLLRISILVGWSKARTSPSITWLWHVLHETRLPTEKYSLPSDAIFWLQKKQKKFSKKRGETQQHSDQTTLVTSSKK
jgi:hypothetical protein